MADDPEEIEEVEPEEVVDGEPLPASGLVLATRAQIRQILSAEQIPTEIRDTHAIDPTVFEDHPPFVFRSIVSNNNIDTYGTRMMPSTLRNFAQDAIAGVSVMAGHMVESTMPLGRTFAGKYRDGRSGDQARQVEVDSFIMTGMSGGAGQHLDDVVDHIRGGVYKDTSVGFYGGSVRCSIDGLNMILSFDDYMQAYESGRRDEYCWHIPGIEYMLVDKGGNQTGDREVAVGEIEDAHMSHFGLVYDGATPGAAVTKARAMAEAGVLRPEMASLIESRYRVRLPEQRRSRAWQGHSTREAHAMSDDQNRSRSSGAGAESAAAAAAPSTSALMDQIRQAFRDSHVAPADWDGDLIGLARSTGVELERLRPLADDGRTYRADLIKDALEEGVRAFGNEFQRERYEGILKRSSIDEIKTFFSDWTAVTKRNGAFSNGRQTQDGSEADLSPAAARDRRTRRMPSLYQA